MERSDDERPPPTRRRCCAALSKCQQERPEERGRSNAQLGPGEVRRECRLSSDARRLMEWAVDHFGLTGRGYSRTLKVARTVADLDGADTIDASRLAEALQYRADEDRSRR